VSHYSHLVKMRIYDIDGRILEPANFGSRSPVANKMADAFFSRRPISTRRRSSTASNSSGFVSYTGSYSRRSSITNEHTDEMMEERNQSRTSYTSRYPLDKDNSLGCRCRHMLSTGLRRKLYSARMNNNCTNNLVGLDRLIDTLLFRPVTSLGKSRCTPDSRRARTALTTCTANGSDAEFLLEERSLMVRKISISSYAG
jgi:hypothetical protein